MGLRGMLLQQMLLGLIILAATAASQPNSSCKEDRCGSLNSIPYPFGTRAGCYLDDSFLIQCVNISGTLKPILGYENLEVLNISLHGELRVSTSVTRDCSNNSSSQRIGSKFPLSNKRNKLFGLGFYIISYIGGYGRGTYGTGCVSSGRRPDLYDRRHDRRYDRENMVNGSCSVGTGCCETSIPEGVTKFYVGVWSYFNNSDRCIFGFVVENEAYNFSTKDLKDLQNRTTVPVVLDWAVGEETCQDAQGDQTTYACKAAHSDCLNSTNGPGYRCNCSSGFEGNPYLLDGCQGTNTHLVSKMIFFFFG
jgi:hypothetical protein